MFSEGGSEKLLVQLIQSAELSEEQLQLSGEFIVSLAQIHYGNYKHRNYRVAWGKMSMVGQSE